MNKFTQSNIVDISLVVKDQFPAFYKEHGQGFIDFVKTYYEWLEQPDNTIGRARGLYKEFDIDTTSNKFLSHYRQKYMWGLPPELLGNQRLLQKHIIELYRSKGSQHAIKLLFRLLFNEEIEIYIPSYDIFKLSDNTWVEPHYLEVTWCPNFNKFINQNIMGAESGSTAIVESYETRYVGGVMTHILFLSNIVGEFTPGELVTTAGVHESESPTIRGSVVGINISPNQHNIDIGETLTATSGDYPIKTVINETTSGTGILTFVITKPGTYYTTDTIINTPAAASGGGAAIVVRSLKDTHSYLQVDDKILPFNSTPLGGAYPFPKKMDSDQSTIIGDSLDHQFITVGSIAELSVLSPGNGYETNVHFHPIDPWTSTSGILDDDGNQVGTNAEIIGIPIIGHSIPSGVRMISSGYNNIDKTPIEFAWDKDPNVKLLGEPIIGAIGNDSGYFENTKSFASSDKYLFDGHYYQDFSYVVRASVMLERYLEILKKLVHPTGNAVFGDVRIFRQMGLYNNAIVAGMFFERNDDDLIFTDVDTEDYSFLFTDVDVLDYSGTAYKRDPTIIINP